MNQRHSLTLMGARQDATFVLHSGVLYKQGSVVRNWKLRYVTLTPMALTYYTSEGGELKGTVDVRLCVPSNLEILQPSILDFGNSKWRLAIQTPSRRLVVAAASERDMNAWAFSLLTLFKSNEGRLLQQQVAPTLSLRERRSSVA